VDLIQPRSVEELAEALAAARGAGRRLLVVGGRTHLDKGNPSPVDAELSVAALDELVAWQPEEMLAVVGAGMPCGRLDELLAEQGQEWPVDAPARATVGGVIAAAASSPRRLRVGPVRDSVLEVELVSGAGRRVRAGGRTVKNVSGYDLVRLLTGSLGTLGVLTQAALKLRPRPAARRTVRIAADALDQAADHVEGVGDLFGTAQALLATMPRPTALLVTPAGIELRLEGWPVDMDEQTALAVRAAGSAKVEICDEAPFPLARPWEAASVVAEIAVAPSRLPAVVEAAAEAGALAWGALAGVGICWVGLSAPASEGGAGAGSAGSAALATLRERVAALGGIAPVVRGPGGLGGAAPAPAVHRRLKQAFDPDGILAPGRFWGES